MLSHMMLWRSAFATRANIEAQRATLLDHSAAELAAFARAINPETAHGAGRRHA